jgi:hypothetical protein
VIFENEVFFILLVILILIYIIIYTRVDNPSVYIQNFNLNKDNYEKEKLFNKKINYVNKSLKYNTKCCILLTMYVKDDRKDLYKNITNEWLNNTNFNIFIVNSSGLKLDIIHPHLKQFTFKQNIDFIEKEPSAIERYSILNALKYFKDDFNNYDIIIKITGKYFTPDLENIIEYIPKNTDIILQNQDFTHGQNCEIFGFKPQKIYNILHNTESYYPTENILYNIREYKTNFYNILKLPPLKIDNNVKRGDGTILKFL